MAKGNYTESQNLIAKWINRNPDETDFVRNDKQLRCYIINGQESHWYEVAQDLGKYIGNGVFHFVGNGGGKGVDYVANSRFCGIIYDVHDAKSKGSGGFGI